MSRKFLSVTTEVSNSIHIWDACDVEEAHKFLSTQTPKQIVGMMMDWQRSIDNGLTSMKEAEARGMLTIFHDFLWNVSSEFSSQVIRGLEELGRYDIVESMMRDYNNWSIEND